MFGTIASIPPDNDPSDNVNMTEIITIARVNDRNWLLEITSLIRIIIANEPVTLVSISGYEPRTTPRTSSMSDWMPSKNIAYS